MESKKIHLIAAARPNFMKVAPLYHALCKEPWADTAIVHTGQHYDKNMSGSFFEDLGLPEPHFQLQVGSGSHAEQTGLTMIAYEKVCFKEQPDLVVVAGDVNATLACSLVAAKLNVPCAHLEAGLRSFDRSMPEELNRIVTDAIANLLLTPSADADENLRREGVPAEKIVRVGNIMIDSLEMLRATIERTGTCQKLGLKHREFAIVTLHRPANVDRGENLAQLVEMLTAIGEQIKLVFPVHPRTKKKLTEAKLLAALEKSGRIILCEPLPYVEFMNLVFSCRLAVTDSGGLQEETTYLGIPCLTLRENTERPVTVTLGTNRLTTASRAPEEVVEILGGDTGRKAAVPELWDGKASGRVVGAIRNLLEIGPGVSKTLKQSPVTVAE